jgi:hypothetical protein
MSDNMLKDLANYLIIYASDVVTQLGVDIFIDRMPDEPDSCVSLNEFLGDVDFFSNCVSRSVQLKLRDYDYNTARTNIWKIFNLLYNPENDIRFINIDSSDATRWVQVSPRNAPYELEKDTSEREIFIFNMGITTNRDS